MCHWQSETTGWYTYAQCWSQRWSMDVTCQRHFEEGHTWHKLYHHMVWLKLNVSKQWVSEAPCWDWCIPTLSIHKAASPSMKHAMLLNTQGTQFLNPGYRNTGWTHSVSSPLHSRVWVYGSHRSFIVIMYSKGCGAKSVNEARHHLFTTGQKSLDNIPPIQASLHHVKRALMQASFYWSQALAGRQKYTQFQWMGLE